MTYNYPQGSATQWEDPAAPPGATVSQETPDATGDQQNAQDPETGRTADIVAAEAAGVGQEALQAGTRTASVAADQAATVAGEARHQAASLVHRAQREAVNQAGQQQQQAAAGLGALGEELASMADHAGEHGPGSEVARQLAGQVQGASRWLREREPADLARELTSFARRRPGVFLALAAGAGLVAGRLSRGLTAGHGQQDAAAQSEGRRVVPPPRSSTDWPAAPGGADVHTAPAEAAANWLRSPLSTPDRQMPDPEVLAGEEL